MMLTNWITAISARYNRLNHFLITRHPFLWQTQVHLVVIFAVMFGTLAFIGGLLYPLTFKTLCTPGADLTKVHYNAGAVCISVCLLFLIYWRKKIVQYKNPDFLWKSAIGEAFIYFGGIVLLWCASNMFGLGLHIKSAWFTLKGEKKYEVALRETNYFINGYLPHADTGKVHQLHLYFAHGDTLMAGLLNHLNAATASDPAIKKYYNALNQNPLLETFFDSYDSLYTYQDTVRVKGKKPKIYTSVHFGSFISKEEFAKLNNFNLLDTQLNNLVYKNLKYSFDEFVPKINYDNYYTLPENAPVFKLGFDNYQKLLDSAAAITKNILFDDAMRYTRMKKWETARYNFLHTLSPTEIETFRNIQNRCRKVFGSTNAIFVEFGLNRPVTADMLQTYEQPETNRQKENRHQQLLRDEADRQMETNWRAAEKKLSAIAQTYFQRDSMALSNQLQTFIRSTSPAAQYWYNLFVDHFESDFKVLLKSYQAFPTDSWRYFHETIDTLVHLYGMQATDSFLIPDYGDMPRNFYWAQNNFDDQVDSILDEKIYKKRTYPGLHELFTKTDTDRFLPERILRKFDFNTDISSENSSLRYGLIAIIEIKAWPWLYYCKEENIFNAISKLNKGKLAIDRYKHYKHVGVDSIRVNLSQIRQEIIDLSAEIRAEIENNPLDTNFAVLKKTLVDQNTDYSRLAYYDAFLADSVFLQNSSYYQTWEVLQKYSNAAGHSRDDFYAYQLAIEDPGRSFANQGILFNTDMLAYQYYQKYKWERFKNYYTPENLQFFKINGFDIRAVTTNQEAAAYFYYYGLDMPQGIREVYRARENVRHFITDDLFQRHILSLLIFINAILFFTVSFETRIITAAFALAFLMLILLNFFLGKFLDINQVAAVSTTFPSVKQKVVFLTILVPLVAGLSILMLTRRRMTLPGFLMNMVVVFALSLLTTNPALYYGDDLQTVEKTGRFATGQIADGVTQYDLFYYLTLYLGLALTLGAVLLRKNQTLPEKRG